MRNNAATSALSPVKGAVGSNKLGSAALDVELEDPLPVSVGFADSGLDFPVMQVLTPLMMFWSWALLKLSQMEVSVLVVWTLDPPRTSLMDRRTTLGTSQ
jgi:hypothetical protein